MKLKVPTISNKSNEQKIRLQLKNNKFYMQYSKLKKSKRVTVCIFTQIKIKTINKKLVLDKLNAHKNQPYTKQKLKKLNAWN